MWNKLSELMGGRRPDIKVEAVITLDIDGKDYLFTGETLVNLVKLYNKSTDTVLAINTSGTGHVAATNVFKLAVTFRALPKTLRECLLTGAPYKNYILIRGAELDSVIATIKQSEKFEALVYQARQENNIRRQEDAAYWWGLYGLSKGYYSYSTNADPNIRRHRVGKAYREIYKGNSKG